MHQIAFGSRAQPGTTGGAYSTPQTPSWIKGSLLLREGMGRKWREGKGMEWREMGERRRESEGR